MPSPMREGAYWGKEVSCSSSVSRCRRNTLGFDKAIAGETTTGLRAARDPPHRYLGFVLFSAIGSSPRFPSVGKLPTLGPGERTSGPGTSPNGPVRVPLSAADGIPL
jgi:hypothetical protein